MGTYSKLTYHIVFGTKFRKPSIRDEFRERLYEYIGGTIRAKNGHLIEIGGVDDHVHVLANLSPAFAISDMVRDFKANSSKWMNENICPRERFEWQKGYGAFSVSYSQIEIVRRYIQRQPEHHRKQSFQDELIEMLEQHEIPFELKYLFEQEYHG